MNIAGLWQDLEAASASDEGTGYFRRRICDQSPFDLNLAVEKPSNKRSLLFRVKTNSVDRATKMPACTGFELKLHTGPQDDGKHFTLCLSMSDAQFREVFTSLVGDIAQRIIGASNEREAVTRMMSRLHEWQIFFRRVSADGLSDEAQRGLYGELVFLRSLISEGLSGQLQCWRGPAGANQDFQFANCAIEVKVTVGLQDQRLEVSNERQLDESGVASLFVQHQSLDVRAGGETLPAIIEDIRTRLQPDFVALEAFESRLIQAGYIDAHRHLYEERGYVHRETNFFHVRDNFPRILESELRSGVGRVRYAITVSQCKQYLITQNEVMELIKKQ